MTTLRLTRRAVIAAAPAMNAVCARIAGAQPVQLASSQFREPVRGGATLAVRAVRPAGGTRYPLVVVTHGVPGPARETFYDPAARELAGAGFAAVVLFRRGFGPSVGDTIEGMGGNHCPDVPQVPNEGPEVPDFVNAATIAGNDIEDAVTHLIGGSIGWIAGGEPVVLVGHSAGGLACLAVGARRPRWLRAVISFAGGHGAKKIPPSSQGRLCYRAGLLAAFARFGATMQVPSLWLYAENDTYFSPALGRDFRTAFAGTARVDTPFVASTGWGREGHDYIGDLPRRWSPAVMAFLSQV